MFAEVSSEITPCTCRPERAARPAVNGVEIDPIPSVDLVPRIDGFLLCGGSHIVHFCPADPTVLARSDPSYRAILNAGDLNLPDGMSVVWALRLLGQKTERITGADAFATLCDAGRERGLRHYLYGGSPSVAEQLPRSLEAAFPGVLIGGAESPPFGPVGDGELADAAGRIQAAGADLLWVGLGTPKQDLVAERLRRDRAAPVILCVGAAFDFLSGAKKRAPVWMQRAGLEWAHRLVNEPKRLWSRYLIGNPRFLVSVAMDALRRERRT